MNAKASTLAPPERLGLKRAAKGIILPALQQAGMLPMGQINAASATDRAKGIEWLIHQRDGSLATVDVHVGWCDDLGAFELRQATGQGRASDLERYAEAIHHGGSVYPKYTVQGYLDRDREVLHQAYVVRTQELIRHIVIAPPAGSNLPFGLDPCCLLRRNGQDSARFIFVAINERGRAVAHDRWGAALRSSLTFHRVDVRALYQADEAQSLGL